MSHCEHLETMSAAKAHAEQSQLFSLTDALHPPLAALPNATRRAELCPYYIVPPPPAGTSRRMTLLLPRQSGAPSGPTGQKRSALITIAVPVTVPVPIIIAIPIALDLSLTPVAVPVVIPPVAVPVVTPGRAADERSD
jgi:hypothetical protein